MYNSRFFNLSYIAQNQDDAEYTINDNIFLIDILLQKVAIDFISKDITVNHGDLYIIKNGIENFINFDNKIGIYDENNGWFILEPKNGLELFLINQSKKYIFFNNNWQLSSNDSSQSNSENVDLSNYYTKELIDLLLINKISKEGNKVLSDNNFSTEEKNKLASLFNFSGDYNFLINKPNIPSIPVNISAFVNDANYLQTVNWNDILLKPNFFSGSYSDLTNKPNIPASQVNSDWNSNSGVSQILNKPFLFDGNYNSLTNKPTKLSQFENDLILSSSGTGNYIGDYKQSILNSNHGNWLLCNGQAISRAIYSALFTLVGTSFGSGDGATTFNLPDFRGRVFGAIGQGSGLTNRTLGQVFGSEAHTLTNNEMPSHNHDYFHSGNWASIGAGSGFYFDTPSGISYKDIRNPISNTGGGQSHNNMQPTLFAGNYFIYSK